MIVILLPIVKNIAPPTSAQFPLKTLLMMVTSLWLEITAPPTKANTDTGGSV